MDLVAPPTRSAFYSISASVSEYTPCDAFTISIDVRNTDYKYLGLLLYAIRDEDLTTETQVGEWLLPTETKSFWTPPGCNGAAVMHSMATEKFFHEEFRFRAPATGTGTLRFRALVKHGETNGGAFYWPSASATTAGPVTADDLIIHETSKSSLPLTRWIFATKGESCEDKCSAAEDSMTCDGKAMVDALEHSGADMMQVPGTDGGPSSAYSCNLPLLSKNGFPCSSRDELHATTFGDCFYRTDGVCPASTPQELCSRSNAGRFCACKLTSEGDTRGASSGSCARLANSWFSKTGKSGATFDEITITGDLLLAETKDTAQVNAWIRIVGEENRVFINIEGPRDRWFAIAFGTKSMASEPYAIVVDKHGWHERRLGKHKAGTELNGERGSYFASFQQYGFVNLLQTGNFDVNRRTLILERSMQGDTDDYYSFTSALGFLNVIVASGATSGDDEFGAYHSPLRRAAVTVTFDRPPTQKPTLKPNARPNAKPSARPNAKPNARPNAKPSARPNAKPSARPNAKPSGPSGPKKEGEEEGTKIGDVLCEQDPDHWSCAEVVDLQYSTSGGGTHPQASPTVAALIATCVYSLTFPSSRSIVVAMVVMLLADRAQAHNWLNNPEGRQTMSKSFPCPPRPSPKSISFIARKDTPFALEWSIGHPGSHVYFAMVKGEDEDALSKNTEDIFNDYLNNAPRASRSDVKGGWTYGEQYKKTHYHMNGGTSWAQPPLPQPGVQPYGYLTSYLVPGKVGYWERPSSWRCARMGKKACESRKMITQQYSMDHYAHRTDLRASYSNPKYPWLVAVMKYSINKRFPQMHDLAQLYFPPRARSGEYVIQYHWRGYYDCVDVLYDESKPSSTGGGESANPNRPQLLVTNEWVKVDHCEYRSSGSSKFTPNKDVKCTVIKAGSSAQECMTRCESKDWCNALNIVPLAHPTDVRFPSLAVNIPFNENECKKENLLTQANDLGLDERDAMVCYGIDANQIPVPNVGEKYKSTEDPRDPAFYSTCYRYEAVTSVHYPGLTNTMHPTPAPKDTRKRLWRTGGKCIECADVAANAEAEAIAANAGASVTIAPKWTLAAECFECTL